MAVAAGMATDAVMADAAVTAVAPVGTKPFEHLPVRAL